MGVSMTTTEARAALHALLARVARGDEVTITRHGRPVAVVVRPRFAPIPSCRDHR